MTMPLPPFRYILRDHEPVPADDDPSAWGEWMLGEGSMERRRVAYDEVDEISISTVFTGVDTGIGLGRLVLFETMIFGGRHNEAQWSYATWDEAEVGHAIAVQLVRRSQEGDVNPEEERCDDEP